MAKKRSILDRYTASQKYIVSRGKALTFPASPFKKELKNDEVYGFVNGAANLYFNLGGEYVNAAARYRGVAQASFDFIKNATACLDCCEKTTKFDMPTAGKNFVYLLTKGGVYKTEIAPNAIPKEAESKKKLHYYYQRVMAELRTAQLKDQAAGISDGYISAK